MEAVAQQPPPEESTALVGDEGGVKNAAMVSNAVTLSQRVRAVRSEFINCLSFLAVLLSLLREESFGFFWFIFVVTGFGVLAIDLFFLKCMWELQVKTHLPIPAQLRAALTNLGIDRDHRRSISLLDDLFADLPQSIWIIGYLCIFKFSAIALVCAAHSGFSICEQVIRFRDGQLPVAG